MNLAEYITKNREPGTFPVLPRIKCCDGFSLSVQASQYNYCKPRTDNAKAYSHVEVGFPSAKPEFITNYQEGSIYPYTPIELVQQLIDLHGGIA